MVIPPPIVRRALEAKKYDKDIVIDSVTFIRGSPRAVEISAMISDDNCTSDTISGDTAAIFSLNHSCLFLIANVMFSTPDRFFFQTAKIAKIELTRKLIESISTEPCG